MPSDSKSSFEEDFKALLPAQKPKGSLPVMVRFVSEPSGKERYILTDIPRQVLKEMHGLYISSIGGTTEEFLAYLYETLGKDSPRIFREVEFLTFRGKPFITYHPVTQGICQMIIPPLMRPLGRRARRLAT